MQRNSFLILIACLFFIGQIAFAQSNKEKKSDKQATYIYYAFAGLGSNLGNFEPTLRVKGTKFKYTYEQNSSLFGKFSNKAKKISSGHFRQSSVDSILDLVKDMKDTLISRFNPCIMSGGIHFLTIANGTDTTKFDLHNTFDYTALKIISIINEYLPTNEKLWPNEELIKREEDCFANLRKELDKKKQTN